MPPPLLAPTDARLPWADSTGAPDASPASLPGPGRAPGLRHRTGLRGTPRPGRRLLNQEYAISSVPGGSLRNCTGLRRKAWAVRWPER